MSAKIGFFFDTYFQKSVIDSVYPGGSEALLSKMEGGNIIFIIALPF